MGLAQQRINSAGTWNLGHQGKAQLFSGIEDWPFGPRDVPSIPQPGAQVGVSDD